MKIKTVNDQEGNPTSYTFWCPACNAPHSFAAGSWDFNGDVDSPTFTPTLFVVGSENRCHSVLMDGVICFLPDSTHAMSGQSVQCPDWDDARV